MLQEVLLALSGHPSPLFDQALIEDFPAVTPAEAESLKSLGHTSDLNRCLKDHLTRTCENHSSSICRTVANTISCDILSRFQDNVLDVEREVLSNDPALVGAHNIVPIASIVTRFDQWNRTLERLWQLAIFIFPSDGLNSKHSNASRGCNGAQLIERLHRQVESGYPSVQKIGTQLITAAQIAWLKQLSAWWLQDTGNDGSENSDFFVQTSDPNSKSSAKYSVDFQRLPFFVTRETALSILHIGKILNYVDGAGSYQSSSHVKSYVSLYPLDLSSLTLRMEYVESLSDLSFPFSASSLSTTVAEVRARLNQQLASGVLPIQNITQTLFHLRTFFLAQRTDFMQCLIDEADKYLRTRHAQTRSDGNLLDPDNLAGVIIKETDMSAVLSKTWASLAEAADMDETLDSEVEWAREKLVLRLPADSFELSDYDPTISLNEILNKHKVLGNYFNDFLLSAATSLTVRLSTPTNLFLTPDDLRKYSAIHSYLLSIRRGQMHLTELWRHPALRKASAVRPGPFKHLKYRLSNSKKARLRATERERLMRATWATLSGASFALTEVGQYMDGEVISRSWHKFKEWACASERTTTANGTSIAPQQEQVESHLSVHSYPLDSKQGIHDPEILALGHRQFLTSLVTSLLLGNETYAQTLRTLLIRIDQLVAFVGRLQDIQSHIDLQDEGVVETVSRNYEEEEQQIHRELTEAGQRVKQSKTALTEELRKIETSRYTSEDLPDSKIRSKTGFEPWKGSGVDRLLVRLQYSGGTDPNEDVDVSNLSNEAHS